MKEHCNRKGIVGGLIIGLIIIVIITVAITIFHRNFYYNGISWAMKPNYDAEESYWSTYIVNEKGESVETVFRITHNDTMIMQVKPYAQHLYVKSLTQWLKLAGRDTKGEWYYRSDITVEIQREGESLIIKEIDDENGNVISQVNFSHIEKPLSLGEVSLWRNTGDNTGDSSVVS